MVKEHTDKTNLTATEDQVTHFRPDGFSFWTAFIAQVD